jgi:hypothetical protein
MKILDKSITDEVLAHASSYMIYVLWMLKLMRPIFSKIIRFLIKLLNINLNFIFIFNAL